MYYVYYREESSNLWRWTLYGEDDRKMAESVEKHYNKADCLAAIEKVKRSAEAPVRER
jgi:uncharacterized protein YegP (UPF0339 family)